MTVQQQIKEIARAKNAVILAHNYELGEIQDIADFCGDSLELSMMAAKTEADILLFCGVRFMAETAKILSPGKKVLLPVPEAPCDMADMVGVDALRQLKTKHPGALTVCYVNTTAAVKAECDLCVTSSNAVKIIRSIPAATPVIFVPDRNLGEFCARAANREMIYWEGFCPVHQRLTPAMVQKRRAQYPGAIVLTHPEAPADTIKAVDHALSTGEMLRFVKQSSAKEFIIGTEIGILHRMEKENPDKKFIMLSEQAVCPHMKLIRLENVLDALQNERFEITVPEEIRAKAELPIRKMLQLS